MQVVLHVNILVRTIMYTVQYMIHYIVEKRGLMMVKRVRLKEMEGMYTHAYCMHKYLTQVLEGKQADIRLNPQKQMNKVGTMPKYFCTNRIFCSIYQAICLMCLFVGAHTVLQLGLLPPGHGYTCKQVCLCLCVCVWEGGGYEK